MILDNSPASYIFHTANAVPVSTWFNDPHDTELTDLVMFLEDLTTVDDVTMILDNTLGSVDENELTISRWFDWLCLFRLIIMATPTLCYHSFSLLSLQLTYILLFASFRCFNHLTTALHRSLFHTCSSLPLRNQHPFPSLTSLFPSLSFEPSFLSTFVYYIDPVLWHSHSNTQHHH